MLLWKEGKENLWKLWFCGGASVVFTIMLFRIRIIPDFANCILISFIQMFAVPVIYSLDIFSGEISNRTVHLLFKIPVPRWMLFLSKYVVSATGIILIFLEHIIERPVSKIHIVRLSEQFAYIRKLFVRLVHIFYAYRIVFQNLLILFLQCFQCTGLVGWDGHMPVYKDVIVAIGKGNPWA